MRCHLVTGNKVCKLGGVFKGVFNYFQQLLHKFWLKRFQALNLFNCADCANQGVEFLGIEHSGDIHVAFSRCQGDIQVASK